MPNSNEPEDLELFHFGVKGMKWGVRRKDRASVEKSAPSRESAKSTTHVSEDSARVKTLRSKPLDSMSNKELQELNNRLNLERQYKTLTDNPSGLQKGKKKADNLLGYAQTGINLYQLANHPATKAGVGLIKKAIK